jgi:RNA polymerase sigma factor (sigma-70 family)
MESSPILGQRSSDETESLEIISLLREDPEKGMMLLLERHCSLLHHVVTQFSRDPRYRDDLFQEVVLELLEKGQQTLAKWDPDRGAFTSYLYLVVSSICRLHVRGVERKKNRVVDREIEEGDEDCPGFEAMDPSSTPRTNAALTEAAHLLAVCFHKLISAGAARDQDLLLVGMRAEGHSAAFVARFLGIEEEVIHLRYSRVRGRLRECLAKHGLEKFEDLVIDFESPDSITK